MRKGEQRRTTEVGRRRGAMNAPARKRQRNGASDRGVRACATAGAAARTVRCSDEYFSTSDFLPAGRTVKEKSVSDDTAGAASITSDHGHVLVMANVACGAGAAAPGGGRRGAPEAIPRRGNARARAHRIHILHRRARQRPHARVTPAPRALLRAQVLRLHVHAARRGRKRTRARREADA